MPKKKGQHDSKSISFDGAQLGDVQMGDAVAGDKITYNFSGPRPRKRKQWGDPEAANQAVKYFGSLGFLAGLFPSLAFGPIGTMLLAGGLLFGAFHVFMAYRQGASVKRFLSIFIMWGASAYLATLLGMRLLLFWINSLS